MERISYTINDAIEATGLSRTELYSRLATGELLAVKNRSRTLITADSLKAFVGSLPTATFRAPKGAAV